MMRDGLFVVLLALVAIGLLHTASGQEEEARKIEKPICQAYIHLCLTEPRAGTRVSACVAYQLINGVCVPESDLQIQFKCQKRLVMVNNINLYSENQATSQPCRPVIPEPSPGPRPAPNPPLRPRPAPNPPLRPRPETNPPSPNEHESNAFPPTREVSGRYQIDIRPVDENFNPNSPAEPGQKIWSGVVLMQGIVPVPRTG